MTYHSFSGGTGQPIPVLSVKDGETKKTHSRWKIIKCYPLAIGSQQMETGSDRKKRL